jgi:hypothetical protein
MRAPSDNSKSNDVCLSVDHSFRYSRNRCSIRRPSQTFGRKYSRSVRLCFPSLPVLEEYIAQSRLPRKLVVHDAWNVLSMQTPTQKLSVSGHMLWDEMEHPDNTYTYKLRLSEENIKRRKAEDKETHSKGERAPTNPRSLFLPIHIHWQSALPAWRSHMFRWGTG